MFSENDALVADLHGFIQAEEFKRLVVQSAPLHRAQVLSNVLVQGEQRNLLAVVLCLVRRTHKRSPTVLLLLQALMAY